MEFLKKLFQRDSSDTAADQKMLGESLSESHPSSVVLSKTSGSFSPPPFENLYGYGLAALLGFGAADLTILSLRDEMLPSSPPPAKSLSATPPMRTSRMDYQAITDRNIFNADGIIPDPLTQEAQDEIGPGVDPVLSTLPLKLVGTIVHINPAKSVATIEVQSAGNKVIPYLPNDPIEGMATLLKVERRKAIFRNSRTGQLEYIEIKLEGISFGLMSAQKSVPAGDVKRDGNTFSLNRTDVNSYIENLPDLLQQARAVPNIIPGSGGQVDGFRLVDIKPGSLYEKLGLQRGDIIKSVNGEEISSPAKAMELYQRLRSDSEISISIERGGNLETLTFNILE